MRELAVEIQELKHKHKAIILAHNYQLDEVQDVADYVGDSFYLSKVAAEAECGTIVFCGVKFMAETAKIISPAKRVLLPEADAGCPLADMITAEQLQKFKERHPGAPVVCYINSSAEVKALSDVCCTSSNAVKIIQSLPENRIIFVPDENLGDFVAGKVPEKELILWAGRCVTHAKVSPEDVKAVRVSHPEAKVLVHPECSPAVVAMADFAGSTSEIIQYARTDDATAFIIGTEMGVLNKLRKLRPTARFFLLHAGLVCPNMKKTRLTSVYDALAKGQHEISVDRALAEKARVSLTRMLELA